MGCVGVCLKAETDPFTEQLTGSRMPVTVQVSNTTMSSVDVSSFLSGMIPNSQRASPFFPLLPRAI